MRNPFILGYISPEDSFCDREKEIKDLSRHAVNCTSVVIYSPRRYGKTSLIKKVMQDVSSKRFMAIYVDLFSVTNKDDFIQKFLGAVVRSIGKDITSASFLTKLRKLFSRITPSIDIKPDGFSISAKYDTGTGFNYLLEDIFDGINKYFNSKKMKGLIVFDEFQEITELKESKHVEGVLHEYIQSQQNLSFFFIGSRRRVLQAMFSDQNRPFFKMAFNYPIDTILRQKFTKYIQDLFQHTKKGCPVDVSESLYDYVDGHTGYVQKLAHILWDITDANASMDSLRIAQKDLLEMESVDFQGVFGSLSRMEKRLVMALAEEPADKPYSKDYLATHKFSLGGVQSSLKSLLNKDIVEVNKNNIYRLTDPLFARWCRRERL